MHDLTFNFQDLIVNSPLLLLHIALLISYENIVLERDNILCMINLCILITCLLENVRRSYILITSGSQG